MKTKFQKSIAVLVLFVASVIGMVVNRGLAR